tara:strand:- start:155 stop:910 length:756 start_codon:yes stop_codon:yes gene_type:complete
MAKFTKGHSFVEDEQITHTKLNNLVDSANFASDAVDGTTTDLSSGAIIVATGGITVAQLADNAVETAKIKDLNVTTGKIANDAITEAKIADNAIQAEHYSDGSIAEEHLNNNVISGQAELAAIPHLTQDEVLISDNGTLKRFALMKHLPLPRAFGVVPWVEGSQTISTAYNVTTSVTVVEDGDVDTCQITLSNNMASADYVVLATQGSSSASKVDSNHNVNIFAKTANSFKIGAPAGTNRVVNFVVFGTLA